MLKLPTILLEKDGRPTRCEWNERRELRMCWALEDANVGSYGRGMNARGLIVRSMSDCETHEFTRHKLDISSGTAKLEANFCPFCGTPMSEGVEQLIEEGEDDEQA